MSAVSSSPSTVTLAMLLAFFSCRNSSIETSAMRPGLKLERVHTTIMMAMKIRMSRSRKLRGFRGRGLLFLLQVVVKNP